MTNTSFHAMINNYKVDGNGFFIRFDLLSVE